MSLPEQKKCARVQKWEIRETSSYGKTRSSTIVGALPDVLSQLTHAPGYAVSSQPLCQSSTRPHLETSACQVDRQSPSWQQQYTCHDSLTISCWSWSLGTYGPHCYTLTTPTTLGMTPYEFGLDLWRLKTRVPELSYITVCIMLHLTTLVKFTTCDRQTDRHTATANTASKILVMEIVVVSFQINHFYFV